jgi:hypothetical protein
VFQDTGVQAYGSGVATAANTEASNRYCSLMQSQQQILFVLFVCLEAARPCGLNTTAREGVGLWPQESRSSGGVASLGVAEPHTHAWSWLKLMRVSQTLGWPGVQVQAGAYARTGVQVQANDGAEDTSATPARSCKDHS